jgi:hypothetical protein
VAYGVLAAAVVVGLIWIWPSRTLSPADQVKRQILQASRAAEQKDLGTIMDQVSPRFRMDRGGLDRDDVKRLLAGRLLTQKWIKVFVVQLSAEEASGGVDADLKLIFGNSPAQTLRELAARSSLEAWEIQAHYEKEEGDWRAVSASVKSISPSDLVGLSP